MAMKTAPPDTRLGALILERGLLSRPELEAALERARGRGATTDRRALLGELLVRERSLGAELLGELLKEQRRRLRGPTATAAGATRAPAAETLDGYLAALTARSARALLLAPGHPPALRFVEGLEPIDSPALTREGIVAMLAEIFTPAQLEADEVSGVLATSFERSGARYRATSACSQRGRSVVLQRVGLDPRTHALRMPAALAALGEQRRGLIIVAAMRGALIADVLATLVATIASSSRRHVIAIERRPIYDHASGSGLVAQRSVGEHTRDYPSALRAALREDPDVIVVGEMRDPEAAATALLAAETGHLVLAGVHAPDATHALRRVVAAQSASSRSSSRATLANTLRALAVVDVVHGKSGDHVIADIVPGTTAVANLIREDRIQQLDATIKSQPGAIDRDAHLAALVASSEVARIVAIERANDPAALARIERSNERHG